MVRVLEDFRPAAVIQAMPPHTVINDRRARTGVKLNHQHLVLSGVIASIRHRASLATKFQTALRLPDFSLTAKQKNVPVPAIVVANGCDGEGGIITFEAMIENLYSKPMALRYRLRQMPRGRRHRKSCGG